MMKALGFFYRLLKLIFGFVVVLPLAFLCFTTLNYLELILSPVEHAWVRTVGDVNWHATWRHVRTGGVE